MECWAGCGSMASGSSPNRQSSASSCPEDQARRPGRRLQVAQDTVERLLVGVVVLPSLEVADVPLVAELHRPRLSGLHNLLVDADGKQHDLVTAPLLGECLADLVLHPVAGDCVLREDQQQLVADANGSVDTGCRRYRMRRTTRGSTHNRRKAYAVASGAISILSVAG